MLSRPELTNDPADADLVQVGGQEGQVRGRQAVAGGLGLVPVGVEQRRGADRVELGALVVAEGQGRGGQVVGQLLVGTGADDQRGDGRVARV